MVGRSRIWEYKTRRLRRCGPTSDVDDTLLTELEEPVRAEDDENLEEEEDA